MPISRAHSFAFVHIPKTAGSSILHVLTTAAGALDFDGEGLWDILFAHPQRHRIVAEIRATLPANSLLGFPQRHFPASVLRKLVGENEWKKMFKFAFVRNPWDLVVSSYHYNRQWEAKQTRFAPERDRLEALARCKSFDHFVRMYPVLEPADMTAMITGERGEDIVDFVGRFESLGNDFSQICSRIGLSVPELPHDNRSLDREDYRSYYTPETRTLVENYFARDLARFGYEF